MNTNEQATKPTRRWSPVRTGAPLLAVLLIGTVAAIKLSGCANKTTAEAGNVEVRLTKDEVSKAKPLFSPDGAWVAYTGHYGSGNEKWGIFLVPRKGGEPRRISPDSLAISTLAWSADGSGLYGREASGEKMYFVGRDGSVRLASKSEPLAYFLAASADGETQILTKFVTDNRELGIRKGDGKLEILASTPTWEEGAVFGPGPGEVTAVARPFYQAPTSTISIWSPETRTYSPLPLPEGLNGDPAWSTDGRYMAYVSYRGGQSDVWIYDHQTARAVQLTSDLSDEGCPGWSPDGEWLAFCRSSRTSHLFSGVPGQDDRHQLTEGTAFDYSPLLSRDGKWVLFMRKLPPDSAALTAQTGPVMCVMPVAGGPVQQFDLAGLTLAGKGMDAFSWSYDSREIAFQANDGSGKMDVYRIGRDGRGLARVTVGPGDDVGPMWSPDGRYISYTQAGGGKTQVMVIPANGGLPVSVSPAGTTSEGGAWSPDSERLAYITYRGDGVFEVWNASRAHPEQRIRVLEDKDLAYPMFWTRDGSEIVLARRAGTSWRFCTVPARGGAESEIGKEVPMPGARGFYSSLTPEGEKHRDLFYPGGEFVFPDGKESSDLYLVRAGELLRDRINARRALSLGSVLLVARAE